MSKVTDFKIVPAEREFKFKGLCPYCGGDLTYTCEGWEEDGNGLWKSDGCFGIQCSTEPDIDNDEWDDWMNQHSDMPYVYQLPVDIKVQKYINERFRFEL